MNHSRHVHNSTILLLIKEISRKYSEGFKPTSRAGSSSTPMPNVDTRRAHMTHTAPDAPQTHHHINPTGISVNHTPRQQKTMTTSTPHSLTILHIFRHPLLNLTLMTLTTCDHLSPYNAGKYHISTIQQPNLPIIHRPPLPHFESIGYWPSITTTANNSLLPVTHSGTLRFPAPSFQTLTSRVITSRIPDTLVYINDLTGNGRCIFFTHQRAMATDLPAIQSIAHAVMDCPRHRPAPDDNKLHCRRAAASKSFTQTPPQKIRGAPPPLYTHPSTSPHIPASEPTSLHSNHQLTFQTIQLTTPLSPPV